MLNKLTDTLIRWISWSAWARKGLILARRERDHNPMKLAKTTTVINSLQFQFGCWCTWTKSVYKKFVFKTEGLDNVTDHNHVLGVGQTF